MAWMSRDKNDNICNPAFAKNQRNERNIYIQNPEEWKGKRFTCYLQNPENVDAHIENCQVCKKMWATRKKPHH